MLMTSVHYHMAEEQGRKVLHAWDHGETTFLLQLWSTIEKVQETEKSLNLLDQDLGYRGPTV